MKLLIALSIFCVISSLQGCGTLEAVQVQYRSQAMRHPCGNIWDICPGDNKFLDTVGTVISH